MTLRAATPTFEEDQYVPFVERDNAVVGMVWGYTAEQHRRSCDSWAPSPMAISTLKLWLSTKSFAVEE